MSLRNLKAPVLVALLAFVMAGGALAVSVRAASGSNVISQGEVSSSPSACATSNWLTQVIESAAGVLSFTCTQPAFSDISGTVNFNSQLSNFPASCSTSPEQLVQQVGTTLSQVCVGKGITTLFIEGSDEAVTGTGLTSSGTLVFSGAVSSTYTITFFLPVTTSTAGAGAVFAIGGPTGVTLVFCMEYVTSVALADEFNACTNTKDSSVGTITTGTTNQIGITGFCTITTDGTHSGNIALKFASGTAGQTTTIKKGGFMKVVPNQ